MNKISRLVENYSRHIAVPWRDDTAPAQRVIFCVYPEYNGEPFKPRELMLVELQVFC